MKGLGFGIGEGYRRTRGIWDGDAFCRRGRGEDARMMLSRVHNRTAPAIRGEVKAFQFGGHLDSRDVSVFESNRLRYHAISILKKLKAVNAHLLDLTTLFNSDRMLLDAIGGFCMPESKLSTYTARTRAYLDTPRGRANFRESRERFGYSYQRALAVAVMVATGLRRYERIGAVVDALMGQAVAA